MHRDRLGVAGGGERVADGRGAHGAALDEREAEREVARGAAECLLRDGAVAGRTATIARGTPAAAIASSDQATIGRPARATNAFGRRRRALAAARRDDDRRGVKRRRDG